MTADDIASRIVHYTGTDKRGHARAGSSSDAAALAEACFKQGWRTLKITAASDGREVGGIRLSDDRPRKRIWWAES